MSPPLIKAQTFFGLKTDILGNAHFVTDTEVIYPAGGVLVLHDFDREHQRFINLPQNQKSIRSISISPNKQFIALSEKSEKKNEKPSIKIYDLMSLELKKTLIIPFDEVTSTEFITLQFTWDSKYLVGIVGEPDWMLYYYNWEGGKIESQTRALNPNGQGKVMQVNCNPTDANVVVITGPQTFRLLNVSETVWRQWGWTKAENLIITSCMWLTSDKVMFGTKSGILMIVENGELKQNCCYQATEVTEISTKKQDERESETMTQAKDQESSSQTSEDLEVRCLTVFAKGFAFSCKSGTVHMFEKESRFKWMKRNIFKVSDGPFRINDKDYIDLNVIQHISVNNNQDTLMTTTLKSQIYYTKLFQQHMDQVPEIAFKEMGEMLHHSKINGLAMCLWKPIFMTSGEADRSIRLWNYETRKLEFVKFYYENINCISLHPTGLFAVIGFTDKLRYMVVLIDDLYQMREFSIRNCKVCKFSNNGHMFAAVDGMVIQVFSSVTFDNVFNLKGHSGIIRALSWAGRDDKIVSCGADGAIYEWCMMTAKRLSEIIMKNNDFTGCSVSSDGKSFYIVGVDGEVKEARNDIIIRNLKIIGGKLDNIVLAHSDMMLFVTGGKGTIVSIQFPLLDKAVFSEFYMHNKNITAVALSYDDQTLISVSEDATMCIWKLDNSEGKAIVLSPDFCYSEEILINKNNLKEKLVNIEELSKRINEMETEHLFEFRQISMSHSESLQLTNSNYSTEIKELNKKIETMEINHSHKKNTLENDITTLKLNHQRVLQDMETDFNEKLIFEYRKYEILEENMLKMKEDYEKQLKDLEKFKNDIIQKLKFNYEAQLVEKDNCIKELCDKNNLELREHEYIKQTIEDDADREILEIKSEYESKLIEGKNLNVILKGETNVLKTKIFASEKLIDNYKLTVSQLKSEVDRFQESTKVLEVRILDLKKAINDRDKIILEKDKKMQVIRVENQTLEKQKFVFDFQIQELNEKIEPKNKEIHGLQNLIQELRNANNKLLTVQKNNCIEFVKMKENLFAMQVENKKQFEKIYDLKTLLKNIHNEIQELSTNIQNPTQLKIAVKALMLQYKAAKYPEKKGDKKTSNEEKNYHETIILTLNQRLENEVLRYKREASKTIQDNIKLLEKINALREELTEANEQINKMKILLGLPAARISPLKARIMINKACTDYDNIEKDFNIKLQKKQEEIEVLKKKVENIEEAS